MKRRIELGLLSGHQNVYRHLLNYVSKPSEIFLVLFVVAADTYG